MIEPKWMILILCAVLVASSPKEAELLLNNADSGHGYPEDQNVPRHALSKLRISNPELIAKKEATIVDLRMDDGYPRDSEDELPEYFGAVFGSATAFIGIAACVLLSNSGVAGFYISYRYWAGILIVGALIGFLCSFSDRVRRGTTLEASDDPPGN